MLPPAHWTGSLKILAIEPKAREAVYASANKASWFAFELPESAVHYQMSDFGRALELVTAAERRGLDSHDDPRKRFCDVGVG